MNSGSAAVAIIGTGELAKAHARVVVAHPDLRLVALVAADERSGRALGDEIANRFEGERPPLFADLDRTLASVDVDVDIVVVGEVDEHATSSALAAGIAVVGGVQPDAGSDRWFPFEADRGPSGGVDDDIAFAAHLRQYESLLNLIGFGPHAEPAAVSA